MLARKCLILDMYHTCIMLHMYQATLAGRKAGRLSTNTAQSVDRLSTNKAYHYQSSEPIVEMHNLECVFSCEMSAVNNDYFFVNLDIF